MKIISQIMERLKSMEENLQRQEAGNFEYPYSLAYQIRTRILEI